MKFKTGELIDKVYRWILHVLDNYYGGSEEDYRARAWAVLFYSLFFTASIIWIFLQKVSGHL